MSWKIINREVKRTTTLRHDDGRTETTEDFKAYFDNLKKPAIVYKKFEFRDPDGKIDIDRSFLYRRTPRYETSDEEYTDTESDTESDSESDSETKSEGISFLSILADYESEHGPISESIPESVPEYVSESVSESPQC